MNVAFDVDGVISAFPKEMGATISAYKAAANRVLIITGVETPTVAKADVAAKKQYLTSLGIGPDLYDQLIVCPKPHAENKAKAIKDNDVAILFDNSKKNVKAAAGECVCLLLWNTKEK